MFRRRSRFPGLLLACLVFIFAMSRNVAAQDLPGVLMDFTPQADPTAYSSPSDFIVSGSCVYFTAIEKSSVGRRLWRSDGSAEETRMVARSKGLGAATLLTDYQGRLYFSCDGALWRTDGTDAGTLKVKDLTVSQMAVVGTKLWILSINAGALELWISNGNTAGTTMAFSLACAPTGVGSAKGIDGKLYFALSDATYGREPWCSDGTAAGTKRLADVAAGSASASTLVFTKAGGVVYFMSGSQLWRTDATQAGTSLVKVLPGPTYLPGSPPVLEKTEYNGLLFIGATGAIYQSDGTEVGTVPAIPHGSANARATNFAVMGDHLYFSLTENSEAKVIRTDGTAAGSTTVSNVPNSLTSYANYTYFLPKSDRLYFTRAQAYSTGGLFFTVLNLYVTDGTSAGTVLVKENMSGHVLFGDSVVGPGPDNEPWISDGTSGGTHLLKDICHPAMDTIDASSNAFELIGSRHGTIISHGPHRTRGTKATTDKVTGASLLLGIQYYANYTKATDLEDCVLFAGNHNGDVELYRLNREGPVVAQRVKDINPTGPSLPECLLPAGEKAWLAARDGTSGFELWQSDGTESGTTRVKDINPGTSKGLSDNYTTPAVSFNGEIYFPATSSSGLDLWKSDGTEEGTQLVKDLTSTSSISDFCASETKIFFKQSTSLFASDGTTAGTTEFKSFSEGVAVLGVFKNMLYFRAGSSGPLWRSDGTASGTTQFLTYYASGLAPLGEKMIFCRSGNEVCATDGSTGGTILLKKIPAGSYTYPATGPAESAIVNNILYFAATDDEHGRELWRTDGTPEGTYLVADLYPGPAGSGPQNLTACGDRIVFDALDPFCGREVWVYPMEGLRESVTPYFNPGDTAAAQAGTTGLWLDFASNPEGGEVRVNLYEIAPPRFKANKSLARHWEVLGLYGQAYTVDLSFKYTNADLSAAGMVEGELRLIHSTDEGLTWAEVPSQVDAANNRIHTQELQTNLFGLWAIIGDETAAQPASWINYK